MARLWNMLSQETSTLAYTSCLGSLRHTVRERIMWAAGPTAGLTVLLMHGAGGYMLAQSCENKRSQALTGTRSCRYAA